ncbi:2' O-ribose methyltransferase [Agyrium rufum]|nr:2' O-ribose methyltransferase [Agyrium rufum]
MQVLGRIPCANIPRASIYSCVPQGALIYSRTPPSSHSSWQSFNRGANTSAARNASSSSSKRWQTRHDQDRFAREARVQGLKSRAAFKLLEINERYKIFQKGQTIVDLGYAPGSWSQVAIDRTSPGGRVVGIDIIPAQPPRGVSTIQGNFLAPSVQQELKDLLRASRFSEAWKGHFAPRVDAESRDEQRGKEELEEGEIELPALPDLLEMESRQDPLQMKGKEGQDETSGDEAGAPARKTARQRETEMGRVVDVVLSDMSAPWEQTTGFWKRSLSNPYFRMMNTSGMAFRDHAGSMDLCNAALRFSYDMLRGGGHFVCKFYQGSEDKAFEMRLKRLFVKVHREKPESSRSESKESFFVAMRRKPDMLLEDVFREE